jgi:hypothetical protein
VRHATYPSGIILVTGPGALRGTIDTTVWPLDESRADVLIQLDSGAQGLVPREALVPQDEGSYYCPSTRPNLGAGGTPAASQESSPWSWP